MFPEVIRDITNDVIKCALRRRNWSETASGPPTPNLRCDCVANGNKLKKVFSALDVVDITGIGKSISGTLTAIWQVLHMAAPGIIRIWY